MPLTPKGEKIMENMKEQYGPEKAKEVFYASANKGTITGVHDSEEAPTPIRRPDLLGTVATPGGIDPAEVKSRDQDMTTTPMSMSSTGVSSSSTGSTSTGTMTDARAKDEKVDLKGVQPPMNNLSRSGNPGATTGNLIPYSGVQVGDSLKNQNARNRAFWARRKR